MDLRRAFFSRSMKLLRHPTVVRLLADPRAMDAFVAAARTKERVERRIADLRLQVRALLG